MSTVIDMAGQKVGRLTVLARATAAMGKARWLCRCDCGNEHVCFGNSLRFQQVQSCGCLKAEKAGSLRLAHGHTVGRTHSREYTAWSNMIQRTRATEGENARNYKDRGIGVCRRWGESFSAFLSDMGAHPGDGYSLDRIDNDLGYEPGNCRWATGQQQRANQRPRERWAA